MDGLGGGRGFPFGSLFTDYISKNGKSDYFQKVDDEPNDEIYDWKKLYESTLADFESYKKRILKQKETEKTNMLKELLLGFLDLVDYMQFAYSAKNTNGTYTEEDGMVLRKLLSFLDKYDVHPMLELKGKPFDHRLHEAVGVDGENNGLPSDSIVQVVSNGFLFGADNDVLRPAKVIVSA